MLRMKRKLKTSAAFTLAELLIVVAIIAVLVAVAIPIFTGQLAAARGAKMLTDIRSLDAAIAIYAIEHSEPPRSLADLDAGVRAESLKTPTQTFTITGRNGQKTTYTPSGATQYALSSDCTKATYVPQGYTAGEDVGTVMWYLEGRSTSGGGAGGGTGGGTGFTVAESVAQPVKDFFSAGWQTADDGNGKTATYKIFNVNGTYYCLAWFLEGKNGSPGDLKQKIAGAYPDLNFENENIQVKKKDEEQSHKIVEELSEYLDLENGIDKISFDQNGVLSVEYRQ